MKIKTWIILIVLLLGTGAAILFWVFSTQSPTPSSDSQRPDTSEETEPEVNKATIIPPTTDTVSGIYRVSVTIDGKAARVELYVDGVLRNVSYRSPFTYDLDTTTLTNGTHTLLIKAYDSNGHGVSSQEVTITVLNTDTETSDATTQTTVSTSRSSGSSGSSGSSSSSGGGSTPTPPDTQAPSNPSGLNITASDSWTTSLSWGASTDNVAVTGYRIFRDGVQVGTSTTTSYTDLDTSAGNDYDYKVSAVDAASNVSGESSEVGISLPELTIWLAADIPGSRNDSDAAALELGFKFRPKVSGTVTGIRFWKSDQDTGTHIGNLWSIGGTNLATATFTGETSTGWQSVHFSSPVSVTANTVYVASYHTNVGHYSADANYFTSNFDNGYIEALQSGDTGGNNGVFTASASSAFPSTTSGNSSHYWVDVSFVPTKGTTATTRVAAGSPNSTYQGYPDASTTGVPANTALIKHPRNLIVPAGFDDLSVEAADITGYLDIYSDNFAITNSKVTSTHFWGINQRDVAEGMTVEHCKVVSIPGQGADNGGADYALSSGSGGAFTARYNDLSLFGKGFQTAAGVIEHNYVHDLQQFIPQGSPDYFHSDAILSGGGTAFGLTIHHNTMLNQIDTDHGASSAIGLYADFGTQFNVTVDDNFIAGGGYATYGGNSNSHDVRFTNNKFSTIFWPNAGFYGPSAYFFSGGTNNVWSNNVWADGPNAGQAVNPAF